MEVILFRNKQGKDRRNKGWIVIEWFWVGENKLSSSWRERPNSRISWIRIALYLFYHCLSKLSHDL